MPVGAFRPEAKTETVKPGGSLISPPLPGANRAVSLGQSGFATTLAAVANPGTNRNGVAASVKLKVADGFSFMISSLPFDFPFKGAFLSAFTAVPRTGKRVGLLSSRRPVSQPY